MAGTFLLLSWVATQDSRADRYTISFKLISGFLAGGGNFRAHVPAGLGPFVILLGQHRADQPDDGAAAGEDPDTSVRRRISLFSRSCGLLLQICRQTSRGKAVNARMSSRASSRWAAAVGSLASSAATTWACWARTEAGPGCSKMVRTRVETHGWAVLGTRVSRLRW